MARGVKLRGVESRMSVIGRTLAADSTERPAHLVPGLGCLLLATAEERARLPPAVAWRERKIGERLASFLLGPDDAAILARYPCRGWKMFAVRTLVPADVRPGQDLRMPAMRTGHKALALVTDVVFSRDPALALDSRRARANELGTTHVLIRRGPFLAELQRIALGPGARGILADLVGQDDALWAGRQIGGRVGSDKVERTARIIL